MVPSNYYVGKNDFCEHCVFGKKIDYHFLVQLIRKRD